MPWFLRSLMVVVASTSMAVVACASSDSGQPPGPAAGMRPACAGPLVVVRGSTPGGVASMDVYVGDSATLYLVVFVGTYVTTADCSSDGLFPTDPSRITRMATQLATFDVQ
jgi:hypothetical protein